MNRSVEVRTTLHVCVEDDGVRCIETNEKVIVARQVQPEFAQLFAAAPRMLAALRLIRDARDYNAEHGQYPAGSLGEDQEFDDWAADVAQTAIEAAGVEQS